MNNIKERLLNKSIQRKFQEFSIDNPKTWCEKMAWLQINDNIDLRARCADKIRVHEYSMEKLGKDICVPIIKVYDSPDDIKLEELPEKFVLKCNHGYAYNIICRDKSELDIDDTKSKLRLWLDTPFGERSVEPHYLKIERKCYAEQYLKNEGYLELVDYKFLCFEGEPTYLQILTGRHTEDFHLNYYDMDGKFADISRTDVINNPNKLDTIPPHFELMKEYARALSKDFHFVRVDFYEVDGAVYLGELTFTPATGFIRWTDLSIDRKFGDMIKL